MEYADVVAVAFEPSPPGVVPRPMTEASLPRRFRDAIEPIAMHSVWSATTNARLASLGLNFMTGYVWGRASALGEPDAGVVVSSFAVFEPMMLTDAYEAGRAACDRDTMLAARTSSTIASLTATLADPSGDERSFDEVADQLQVAATTADATGRPLFAGFQRQPWPDDPIGRIWHACELLREHRGDSHVAVCVAHGMTPVEMNILTELWVGMPLGSYSGSRAWSPEVIAAAADDLRSHGLMQGDELTEDGRALRDRVEDDTDALEAPIVESIAEVDALIAQLAGWSRSCVEMGAFPPNLFKHAAG